MADIAAGGVTGHFALLEALPVMILDLDGDGAVAYANQHAREGLELGQEAVDKSIAELVEPADRDAVLSQIRELWSGEGEITNVWRLRATSGKILQVDANAISIHENGYAVRVRLFFNDRNAPKAAAAAQAPAAQAQAQLVGPIDARAALKEEREYTKALIQKSGLLVYIFDTKGLVVEINKKMEDITGFTRDMCPDLEALLRGLYPEERYRQIVTDVHRNMFQNRHLRDQELKISTTGGDTRHISWSTARLKNAKGEVHGFIAAGVDVTEKKRLEHWAKLQASCLERISDGVIISDMRGDIIQWLGRAEEMLGFSDKEMIGRRFTDVLPADERRLVNDLIDEDIEKVGQWRAELDVLTSSGLTRPVDVEIVLVRNESSQPIALVMVLRDRAPSKAVVSQLAEVERRVVETQAQSDALRARGDELETRLRDADSRAENYLARADAMAAKNRDLEGEINRLAGGRAAMEQAVNELSIFQLSVLGVASVSIVTTDGGGQVTNWSKGAEEFTGYDSRQAMGARLHDEVFIIEGHTWDSVVQETLDKGGFRGMATLVRADNTRKPIIIDATVLNDEHGNPVGITEVAVEFTGAPGQEMELFRARADSLLGELTPAIARDASSTFDAFSSNLQRLVHYTRVLKKVVEMYRMETSRRDIEAFVRRVELRSVLTDVDDVLGETESASAQLRNLTQDLQRFLPGSVTELEVLAVNDVVEVADHLARGTVAHRGRVQKTYTAGATVLASANEATRAVLHLLLAAGHALPTSGPEGEIAIHTTIDGDRARIDVRHNGEAIGLAVRDQLGDPTALVRSTFPTAIALGLAREIIDSLGGTLNVLPADGGEVFRMELPLADAGVVPAATDLEEDDGEPAGHVLFVDSDPIQLRAFRRYFERRHHVTLASEVGAVLTALRSRQDMGAVVLSGQRTDDILNLYRQIRDANAQAASRVVFLLPGGETSAQRRQLLKTGHVVLERPIPMENLASVVSLLVGPSRA